MRLKGVITTVLFLGVLFIALGDRVLPKPLSTASYQTRMAANNFLMGLFPNKKFKNPNERTEKAIQKEEQGAGSNQK